jgi:hypothetical protein
MERKRKECLVRLGKFANPWRFIMHFKLLVSAAIAGICIVPSFAADTTASTSPKESNTAAKASSSSPVEAKPAADASKQTASTNQVETPKTTTDSTSKTGTAVTSGNSTNPTSSKSNAITTAPIAEKTAKSPVPGSAADTKSVTTALPPASESAQPPKADSKIEDKKTK